MYRESNQSAIHNWETNHINFQLYQPPPTIIDNHSGPLLWTKSEKFLSVGFFQILSVEGAEGYLGDLAMDYCTTVTASAAHQTHRIKRKQVKNSFVGFSVGYLVYLKFISTLKWTRQNDFHKKKYNWIFNQSDEWKCQGGFALLQCFSHMIVNSTANCEKSFWQIYFCGPWNYLLKSFLLLVDHGVWKM